MSKDNKIARKTLNSGGNPISSHALEIIWSIFSGKKGKRKAAAEEEEDD